MQSQRELSIQRGRLWLRESPIWHQTAMTLQDMTKADLNTHLLEANGLIAQHRERLKSPNLQEDERRTLEARIIQLEQSRILMLEALSILP